MFNTDAHLQFGWNTNTSIMLLSVNTGGKMLSVSLFKSFFTISSKLKGAFLVSRLNDTTKPKNFSANFHVLFMKLVVFSLIWFDTCIHIEQHHNHS